jgi:caffeoyl-CoA O-methyltransferase
MRQQMIPMTAALQSYVLATGVRAHPAQAALYAAGARLPGGHMQIGPEYAQLLDFLIRVVGAQRAIEVGVFAGYSALAMALALPPDGHLLACEISDQHIGLARQFWEQAGVEHKIDLRLAPALATLDDVLARGHANTYDFAFIDADKRAYMAYYERCLALVRRGGIVAVDNVLWKGHVAAPEHSDKRTAELRRFNAKLHADNRIDLTLLPYGDGITLARKR